MYLHCLYDPEICFVKFASITLLTLSLSVLILSLHLLCTTPSWSVEGGLWYRNTLYSESKKRESPFSDKKLTYSHLHQKNRTLHFGWVGGGRMLPFHMLGILSLPFLDNSTSSPHPPSILSQPVGTYCSTLC